MSADVPVDQPQGELVTAAREDAWQRWFWLWELYFAVGYLALCVLLLSGEDDASTVDRFGAVGVVSGMAVWYLACGRRAVHTDYGCTPWRGRAFMLGMLVLLIVGVTFQASVSFALFALCPLAFMTLELREAIFVIVPANLVPVLVGIAEDGASSLLQFLPGTVLTIAFGVMLGTWIHRIISQSVERAALIRELEASREEVERLSREAGVATERARLATEIHDTLAQGFTSLVTLVQAAESELDGDRDKARRHLRLAARTARENLDEARALVADLMPSALGTGSLDEAIRRQLERLAEETPIKATYQVEGESTRLATGLEVVLLRAVQESLTNVRKHSGASTVSIRLRVNGSAATLRVADDGTGFDASRPTDGYGLIGMRSRATQVGGSVSVHSGESGTTVELEVPR